MVLSAPRVVLAAALFLSACIGARAPERLEAPAPVAVAVWLEGPGGAASPAPAGFMARAREALAARGLVAEVVPVGDVQATTTAERLAAVRQRVTAPHVLLVEARATFFSQLAGRFRWDVDVRLVMAPREGEPAPREVAFGVAAFLQYEHEREADALTFATRQVVDELETLADRYVRSQR